MTPSLIPRDRALPKTKEEYLVLLEALKLEASEKELVKDADNKEWEKVDNDSK